ncbi:MAG: alpha-ribazole phosphatase family protein [Spirochaetia bacterium]|nr:alpha-ribazole phosphatase family protein [Spirochaetia bacterium]
MEIYLIRHTKVADTSLCYGQMDVELADTFFEEAESIKKKLGNLNNFTWYASPLSRCQKLASYLFDDFITDDRLKEINLGDWQGKKWSDVSKQELDKWAEEIVKNPPPNGESLHDFANRLKLFLDEIVIKNKNSVFVTHGGCIRVFMALIKNLPLQEAASLQVDYGEIKYFDI